MHVKTALEAGYASRAVFGCHATEEGCRLAGSVEAVPLFDNWMSDGTKKAGWQ